MLAGASTSPPNLPTCDQSVAGIDGCKTGWVMVRRDKAGRFDAPVFARELCRLRMADMNLIDIPIGLPETGRRKCDVEARVKLGSRRKSVFSGVRRPLLHMESREEAHTWANQDCIGVSQQLWGILKKVREVDEWIAREGNRALREGHPELSFLAAAGRPMKSPKKSAAGLAERLEALEDFIPTPRVLELMKLTSCDKVAPDDILDAFALCRSAARVVLDCHEQVPADPPKDARGLAMEMVF